MYLSYILFISTNYVKKILSKKNQHIIEVHFLNQSKTLMLLKIEVQIHNMNAFGDSDVYIYVYTHTHVVL